MKFRIGQVIEHKISKRKYVVIRYSYLNIFRVYPVIVLTDDSYGGNYTGFECEYQEEKQ